MDTLLCMQVLVAGGGYAGLGVIKSLEAQLPRDVDLTLVDKDGTHLIQHELHRVIRYPELADNISIPLDQVVERTDIIEATVDNIAPHDASITLDTGERLEPTLLVICLGAVTADWGIPGVSSHSTPMKAVDDALLLHEKLTSGASDQRVAVVGAGLSGVQVAGELAAIQTPNARSHSITLLEQADRVAPTFPSAFSKRVGSALEEAGVTIQTETKITRVGADGIQCADGHLYAADHVVWTAGIAPPAAVGDDRYAVRADLRLQDRTFALGDAAIVTDNRGMIVPAAAQTAIRQAPVVATNIARLLEAKRETASYIFEPRLKRYTHSSPGWVVSIGDDAVAMVGDSAFRGHAAKTIKFGINTGYLGSIGAIDRSIRTVTEHLGWPTSTDV